MEYTKGEWGVHTINDVAICNSPTAIFIDSPTFTLAEIKIKSSLREHQEEALANAHLIAAAPEMYEALKRILDDRNSALAREAGRKALAKAEGKG